MEKSKIILLIILIGVSSLTYYNTRNIKNIIASGNSQKPSQEDQIKEEIKSFKAILEELEGLQKQVSDSESAKLSRETERIKKTLDALQNLPRKKNNNNNNSDNNNNNNNNSEDTGIIVSEKIFLNEGIEILSGQVIIKLTELSRDGHNQKACFELTLPSMEKKVWQNMAQGTRRQFEYDKKTHFFDLMSIGDGWAIFEIKKRRA